MKKWVSEIFLGPDTELITIELQAYHVCLVPRFKEHQQWLNMLDENVQQLAEAYYSEERCTQEVAFEGGEQNWLCGEHG